MNDGSQTFGQAAWQRLKKNKGAMLGLVLIALSLLIALFGYLIAPDPSPFANRIILEVGGEKPATKNTFLLVKKNNGQLKAGFFSQLIDGRRDEFEYVPITSWTQKDDSVIAQKYIDEGLSEPVTYSKKSLAPEPVVEKKFWLGTDKYGRDILSRLIIGTRVSLSVGLITVLISLTVGITLGSIAGYFKGKADNIIMWLINVIWSIPTLLLVFAITLVVRQGFLAGVHCRGFDHVGECGPAGSRPGDGDERTSIRGSGKGPGVLQLPDHRSPYFAKHTRTHIGYCSFQFCFGDRDRSGAELFRCGRSAAAAKLGTDDQGEL
jgi:ABC-type dipeptide/oligopeptide/nickel transport system permease subunit